MQYLPQAVMTILGTETTDTLHSGAWTLWVQCMVRPASPAAASPARGAGPEAFGVKAIPSLPRKYPMGA